VKIKFKRAGIIIGIIAFFMVVLNNCAWANVILPIYSTGFGFWTLIISMPIIVLLEVLIISYLSRKANIQLKGPIWKVCLKANLVSSFFGYIIGLIFAGILKFIWLRIADYSSNVLFMRQLFLGSFIATIVIEALVYQSSWSAKKWYTPEKSFYFWSFASNSLTYGIIGWFFVLGWLRPQDTAPGIWYFLRMAAKANALQ